MSAQRAHLRVAEVCVGAFGVTTMTKAHELDFRIDPGGGFDLRYMPKEVADALKQQGHWQDDYAKKSDTGTKKP